MKSILEDFANGDIDPTTQSFRRDAEYDKTLESVCDCEQKLLDRLNVEDKALFQRFSAAQSDLHQRTATEQFICGYRLGVQMTAEVFLHAK